jgi:hypothetical protein
MPGGGYGVYQAAADGPDPRDLEFPGVCGCTGLFRFVGTRVPPETVPG